MSTSEYNNSVKIYADDVFRFAFKSSGSSDDAKDIVQQCFEVLWNNKLNVEPEKVKSYLFTIAQRKSIDLFRQRKPNVELEHVAVANNNMAINRELKRSLDKALMTLDEQQRTLVLLKDVEGYNYVEIGKITGLSLSQVKVYLFRARKLLQQQLEVYKHII